MQSKSRINVTERAFSDDESKPSIGLANISAAVPDIEANKDKVLAVLEVFRERKVNIAIFPEFTLSGYFWEDEDACWRYMDRAVIEEHTDWVGGAMKRMLNADLRAVIFNNIRRGPGRKHYNSTYILTETHDCLTQGDIYNKVFIPALEKTYTESGRDDRLVIETAFGRFGFTTCYDYMFSQLLLEYAKLDHVDALIQVASWRAMARRDYPRMNVKTDTYYGYLWDLMLSGNSATFQVWTIACNAVGTHPITGARFWGGSGLWAPSGMPLVQASRLNEELLIVHNVDFKEARQLEKDDFDYGMDFNAIYRPVEDQRTFTRITV